MSIFIWLTIGVIAILIGGWFFTKWILRKKGWKVGGGVWFTIFLLYVAAWTYMTWPSEPREKEEVKKEKVEQIKIDTIKRS